MRNLFRLKGTQLRYRLLTKEYVKVVEEGGRKILKVDPEGLEILAKEAVSDISFFFRTSHLEKLAAILEDPEATDNDRFVAYMMLRNTVISQKRNFLVPGYRYCNCNWEKGRECITGGKDAEYLSKGIYRNF